MTDHLTTSPGADPTATTADRPASPRAGLSGLVVPAILLAVAVFLTIGTVSMQLPPSVQVPGPRFFPVVVIVVLVAMAVLSAISVLRGRDGATGSASGTAAPTADAELSAEETVVLPAPDVPPGRAPWPAGAVSDWRALLTVLGSLVVFIVLLVPLGWILAGALLFFGVAWALGARRPVFDASVALVMSSAVQLLFGLALGITLPAGFLEGVL